MDDDSEICMVISPHARHLRAVRLVAADAGGQAGLDASEVDDLRIAVAELCCAVMESTRYKIVVRIVVHGSNVMVCASARRHASDPAPRLSGMGELIVDAVSDHYRFEHTDSEIAFTVSKTAGRLSRR